MPLISTSPAFLSAENPARRRPRAPNRHRDAGFHESFEDRALLYDVFWDTRGKDILGIGPAPINLAEHWEEAEAIALPSGTKLAVGLIESRSAMLARFTGAPKDTRDIALTVCGERFVLAVHPSLTETFAGRRLLFAMNRNNRLDWIAEWAAHHQRHHGSDAILVFDNGSEHYTPEEIDTVLGAVPGISVHAVVPVPHKFGPIDKSVLFYRFYPRFLQVSMLTLALHRFGAQAAGLLNCDVDELTVPVSAGSVYELAARSASGLVTLKGQWVEPVITSGADPETASHRDFTVVRKRGFLDYCPDKWVLDPSKLPAEPPVFLYPHSVKPKAVIRPDKAVTGKFFHYRGINTNWKHERKVLTPFDPARHRISAELEVMWKDEG